MTGPDGRVAVVMITRDRCAQACSSVAALARLPEEPEIIVVDNGSGDGTAAALRAGSAPIRVIELDRNRGAAGRTVGALATSRPYVAFCDDDTTWAPGSLRRAADLLDAFPGVAVLAARMLIAPEMREDPLSTTMASSPLGRGRAPGPQVIGMQAGASVVRREPFVAVGGFAEAFGVGGEEELLALDLMTAGWTLCYVEDLVTCHSPGPRDRRARVRTVARNQLWTAWLRYPAVMASSTTVGLLRRAVSDTDAARGVGDAIRRLPWALQERAVVPPAVAEALRVVRAADGAGEVSPTLGSHSGLS